MNPEEDQGLTQMSLRVAHVMGGGDTGGAMTYVLSLITALRRAGCDVTLICLGAGGLAEQAEESGLPHEILPMRVAWDVGVLPRLRRRLADGAWDVVHTHGMRANLPVRALIRTMSERPALFTTVHSDLTHDYPGTLRPRMYAVLDRLSARAVDGFFCVSRGLADALVAMGIPAARIGVVYAGIEPPADVAAAAHPVVGTVARLVEVKDIDLLLRTVRIAKDHVPGLRAVIVGDGPERTALERQAEEAGIGDVVEFSGHVRDVWSMLRQFQVYALTSVSEGVPLAVLEAMSVGLPVVATAVGGLPEIIDDGVHGYLVERDDRGTTAVLLAERIATLLTDAGTRARLGIAARARIQEAFSPAAAARTTLRWYGRAVAARRDRGGW